VAVSGVDAEEAREDELALGMKNKNKNAVEHRKRRF
jgi:hypothetical protein